MSRGEGVLLRSAPWAAFAARVVLPWALGALRLEGDALEVGCGSGAGSAALLRRFPQLRLTATDVDPRMVDAARARLVSFGERAIVDVADASQLPFEDNRFDAAISILMLHHVGRWEAAVQELIRVVKPGGRVIGCDLTHTRLLDRAELTFGSGEERLIRIAELSRLLGSLGLRGWQTERGFLPIFRFELYV